MTEYIHETLPEEVKSLEARQFETKLKEHEAERSRQMTKAFLTMKAQEFIVKSSTVPYSRKSRRQAARDIAKRFLTRMKNGDTDASLGL